MSNLRSVCFDFIMADATYTITVKNESGDNQEYLFFNQPPSSSTELGKAWANVWIKTSGTPSPHGKQKLVVTTQNFAVAGTTAKPLADGVVVSQSDERPSTTSQQRKTWYGTVTGYCPGCSSICPAVRKCSTPEFIWYSYQSLER